MTRLRLLAVTAVTLCMSVSAFAALSQKYADWPKGPEQWLMTRGDARAWKNVTTDEQAQAFIDLFWARRDPTPGTPLNEFHERFDKLVAYADVNFKSYRGKRGSLTDPGRVFILLGPPQARGGSSPSGAALPSFRNVGESSSDSVASSHSRDGGTGRGTASARMEWKYERSNELGLTGNVLFFSNVTSHEFAYDPRSKFVGALDQAVAKAIVSPQLTEVPDWAKVGATQ